MIGLLIQLLIVLLIVGLVYWAVTAIIGLIPLPPPFGQIANVLLIVIIALILIFYALVPILHVASSSIPLIK